MPSFGDTLEVGPPCRFLLLQVKDDTAHIDTPCVLLMP